MEKKESKEEKIQQREIHHVRREQISFPVIIRAIFADIESNPIWEDPSLYNFYRLFIYILSRNLMT